MIKDNQSTLNRLNIILDFLILVLAAVITNVIFSRPLVNDYLHNLLFFQGMLQLLVYCIANMAVLLISGYYAKDRLRHVRTQLLHLITVNLLCIALLDLSGLINVSTTQLAVFFGSATLLMAIKLVMITGILRYYRYYGYNQKHVIILGSGNLAHRYVHEIFNNPQLGFMIDGYLASEPAEGLGPYLGPISALDHLLEHTSIDEVVVALEKNEETKISELIETTEKWGTKIRIIPFYNDEFAFRPTMDEIGNVHLLSIRTSPLDDPINRFVKRLMDIILSALALIVLSPLMLIIALLVKTTSNGPILFRQQRVGYNRIPFDMLKFRTMVVNDQQDNGWSRNDDNRKTPIGAFLRKFSLDELPQLLNVLKGEMSLIGPRPEVPYYVDKFKDSIPKYMVKHQVKPGISGWAQVNGFRGDTSIKSRIEYDLYYIDHWSLGLDIKIIIMTIFGGFANNEHLVSHQRVLHDAAIYVATTKPYWMPSDDLYRPLQVGAYGHTKIPGYTSDDSGDNISFKNPNYCELTGLYWIYKNDTHDYVGLVHYRRHFSLIPHDRNKKKVVLSRYQLDRLLQRADVVLPKKRHYWIETNASQYAHAHYGKDLHILRELIQTKYPDYLDSYDKTMKKRSGHRFNMMVMKKDILDAYCSFLFSILSDMESRVDITSYDAYNQRIYGFIGERLLDVWLDHEKVKYIECGWVSLESQHWPSKIKNFIIRKFKGGH